MVADFETATSAWNENGTRVWLWGLALVEDSDNSFEWGTTMESFLERISEHNSNTYFHNLKFDGWFIVDYLLKNGYTYYDGKSAQPKRTFKALISDMGQWYSVTVAWENGHTTEFRDSAKKLPMSVKRIAESFGLDEAKGELDYDNPRPIGHEPTEAELDYLRADVLIVAKALKEVIGNGMVKLTVASDSLAEYKSLVGGKWFSRSFPVLSEHMDAEIRRAYRGGFTYADKRFRKQLVGAGSVYDVNSLYPYIMSARPLPYDMPEFVDGKIEGTAERPLTIFSVTFTARLKPEHIPCIQIKGHAIFGGTEYVENIDEPITQMVTNVDWDLYNEQYDIDVYAYGGGWRFRAATGMFADYINKWSKIKAESTGGKREIAKLCLNSLYGKFASNPNITSKIPVLDEDGSMKLIRGEDETRPPVYTAMGVFITSFARDLTIRAAQANYATFAYADTDSLHLLQTDVPDNLRVHPTELGAWKHEYNFTNAFYIRAKGYLEKADKPQCKREHEHDHTCYFVNHIAGVKEHVARVLTFEHVQEGTIILEGNFKQRPVRGGIVLEDSPFTLKI